MTSKNRKLTSVDLFAGIGGITLGFEAAGIETIAAIEKDQSCAEIFNLNFPRIPFLHEDIHTVDAHDLQKRINGDLTVVVGGPPCQGFSLMGLRDPKDPRSELIFQYRRFVRDLRPDYFVMENVPGMLTADGGRFVEELISLLEADGYNVSDPRILNACEFGAPQDRRRVFILGTRKDLLHHLDHPVPTHRSPRQKKISQESLFDLPMCATVWDAIHDLPNVDLYDELVEGHEIPYDSEPLSDYAKLMRGDKSVKRLLGSPFKSWNSKICTNCKKVVHGSVLTQRFKETLPGEVVPISRLYRLKWDDISNTLRAGTPSERGSYSSPRPVHPSMPRCITVREGARLQGFPDWFSFHPTKWHGFRQVGNSVSPFVAKAVAEQVVLTDKKNRPKG